MLQTVDKKLVFVVEFSEMPELPVTGTGIDQYYAEALTQAILTGVITKPGKYGINVNFLTNRWEAYELTEPDPWEGIEQEPQFSPTEAELEEHHAALWRQWNN